MFQKCFLLLDLIEIYLNCQEKFILFLFNGSMLESNFRFAFITLSPSSLHVNYSSSQLEVAERFFFTKT